MSIDTLHRRWKIEPGDGFSFSVGPFGLNVSHFALIGDRNEEFDLKFLGGGPGVAVNLNIRGREVPEAEDTPGIDLGLNPSLDVGTDVIFSGTDRRARNFDGWGYIIEIGGGIGLHSSVQFLIFNLAASPFVIAQACEMLWQYRTGRIRDLRELRRVAPALALTAGLNLGGIGGGATVYHGRWGVVESEAPARPSAPALGSPSAYLY